MNVTDYLKAEFNQPSKKVYGFLLLNDNRQRKSHALFSSLMKNPITIRRLSKLSGRTTGYLGKKIRLWEKDGLVKCVGQTIGAQCQKPSYLWVWCDNQKSK